MFCYYTSNVKTNKQQLTHTFSLSERHFLRKLVNRGEAISLWDLGNSHNPVKWPDIVDSAWTEPGVCPTVWPCLYWVTQHVKKKKKPECIELISVQYHSAHINACQPNWMDRGGTKIWHNILRAAFKINVQMTCIIY